MWGITRGARKYWFEKAGIGKFPVERTIEWYEYRCPKCGYVNKRPYKAKRIVCDRCGHEFYTDKWDRWVKW